MNHLEVVLAARAHRHGSGLRTSLCRHRRLIPDPIAVVLWQMGAEPFSAAAIGWGTSPEQLKMRVAGEPRNRDLAFGTLLEFANWFNPRFEAPASDRETVTRGNYEYNRAIAAPQIIIANAATIELLGNIGRRLAYLPTSGPRPAPIELVRLGKHLRFVWDRYSVPGQQLVVAMTDLLNDHWSTAQSPQERQSLAALDAYIEPPPGRHGFDAAARAEDDSVGPTPPGQDDELLEPLLETFNELRAGSTSPSVIRKLIKPIYDHYRPRIERAWEILWRCRNREGKFQEAKSIGRRWDDDREAYTRHIDWLAQGGLRRTRQTVRQAAMTLRTLEDATRLVAAEEACDDALRIIPLILDNKAVAGRVVAVDREHRERASRAMVRRPLVRLLSPDPCLIPIGKELWWTEQPGGREFTIHSVEPLADGSTLVTLKLMTGNNNAPLPVVNAEACFSIHNTMPGWFATLPTSNPWTHEATLGQVVEPIDDTDQEG